MNSSSQAPKSNKKSPTLVRRLLTSIGFGKAEKVAKRILMISDEQDQTSVQEYHNPMLGINEYPSSEARS